MNIEQAKVATECAALSAGRQIHFGDVISRLTRAGIERYHADYSRRETTYYTPDGDSCVVAMGHEALPIAEAFSAAAVQAAVSGAQRGEILYPEFTRQVLAAGCVGYFVQLTGRCVQYFGRDGQTHTEWFPGAKPA